MKVSELIEQLSKQNQDLEECIDTDGAELADDNVVSVNEEFFYDGTKFKPVFITEN